MMKHLLLAFTFLFFFAQSHAQLIPEHSTQSYVTDYCNLLTPQENKLIDQKIRQFRDASSIEIAILLIPTMDGADIKEYVNKIFTEWGIGKKKLNNGLLIFAAINDRKWRIEVGYELEEYITDAECNRIGKSIIAQNFKQQKYFVGLNSATDEIISILKPVSWEQRGKYKAILAKQNAERMENFWSVFFIVLTGLVIGGIIFILYLRKKKRDEELKDKLIEKIKQYRKKYDSVTNLVELLSSIGIDLRKDELKYPKIREMVKWTFAQGSQLTTYDERKAYTLEQLKNIDGQWYIYNPSFCAIFDELEKVKFVEKNIAYTLNSLKPLNLNEEGLRLMLLQKHGSMGIDKLCDNIDLTGMFSVYDKLNEELSKTKEDVSKKINEYRISTTHERYAELNRLFVTGIEKLISNYRKVYTDIFNLPDKIQRSLDYINSDVEKTIIDKLNVIEEKLNADATNHLLITLAGIRDEFVRYNKIEYGELFIKADKLASIFQSVTDLENEIARIERKKRNRNSSRSSDSDSHYYGSSYDSGGSSSDYSSSSSSSSDYGGGSSGGGGADGSW